MNTSRHALASLAALVIMLGATLFPLTLSAGSVFDDCHDCAYDPSYGYACLPGCGTSGFCYGLVGCSATSSGCRGTGHCDPMGLLNSVSPTGLLAVSDDARANALRFIEADGSVVYRRPCDAKVLSRAYPEPLAAALRATTRSMTV